MSQGSLDPKIRFLGQKVCSVARMQTDRHESEYRGHPFRVKKTGFVMTQPGPNDTLSQNFMMLGLLVASENTNKVLSYIQWIFNTEALPLKKHNFENRASS